MFTNRIIISKYTHTEEIHLNDLNVNDNDMELVLIDIC